MTPDNMPKTDQDGAMRSIKLNLNEHKNIIMQLPDDADITSKEAILIMADAAQDQIVDGNMVVTKRLWPCLYCGKDFLKQVKLVNHLEGHANKRPKYSWRPDRQKEQL